MLAEELDNQCAAFLVAEDAATGQVIGYAGLLVAADEGYITNVAVFPRIAAGARRGSSWTCSCALPSQPSGVFDLRGAASNAAAIALYTRFGFREAGRRRNYYDLPKEDALILTRTFEEDDQ